LNDEYRTIQNNMNTITKEEQELRYDDFGTLNRSTDHETEKEAVISLIHKMELKGWREVSL